MISILATLIVPVLVVTFLLSSVLTAGARSYALRRALLDAPNQRSSHTEPTPRGGGIAIVVVVLLAATLLWLFARIDGGLALALIPGGLVVALIGWLDDHRSTSPLLRFCVQVAAAGWAVYNLGFVAEIDLGGYQLHMSLVAGWVVTVVALVWMINLYNFMDGTDGIAAGQAICAGLGAALLVLMKGQAALAVLLLTIAGSSLGFLRWNWPRARIFMGDVGSGFLGYAFGVMILASLQAGAVSLVIWSLLLGIFICDSTFTLVRRLLGGERVFSAHRSHAYQRLVQLGWTHRKVLFAFLGMNVLVLWPLIITAMKWNNYLLLIGIAAVLLQFVLWLAIQVRAERTPASGG